MINEEDYINYIPDTLKCHPDYLPKYWAEEVTTIHGDTFLRSAAYCEAYNCYQEIVAMNSLNPDMNRCIFWLKQQLIEFGFSEKDACYFVMRSADQALEDIKDELVRLLDAASDDEVDYRQAITDLYDLIL